MGKVGYTIALLLLTAVVAPLTMTGADKLKNRPHTTKKKWHWVARRHKDDGNSLGHIAYVVKVGPQTAFPDKLEAALWAYDSVVQPGGAGTEWKYVLAAGYPITLPEVAITNGSGDLLRRERGTFKATIGGEIHTLGVALNQRAVNEPGKSKGKSKKRPHERVVMRYTIEATTIAAQKDGKRITPCPEIPEDDVLEEESVPDPVMGVDYPDP